MVISAHRISVRADGREDRGPRCALHLTYMAAVLKDIAAGSTVTDRHFFNKHNPALRSSASTPSTRDRLRRKYVTIADNSIPHSFSTKRGLCLPHCTNATSGRTDRRR
ncbi:hypothetical protein EYF80_024087 [Liparis tanakae]|uniref:Uncharacterized protein n=1 Tax=Liparis tanakae TaxID=230148 RepID=A0A4Z2HL27_9TELE|nr:hypothetical protein EYF80_024087 [Liparis tanakae]